MPAAHDPNERLPSTRISCHGAVQTMPLVETGEFEHPEDRRWWLLRKALECGPLEKAIDLARVAEAFVTGIRIEPDLDQGSVQSNAVVRAQRSKSSKSINSTSQETPPAGLKQHSEPRPSAALPTAKSPKLVLSPGQRELLLERLAKGEKNAELAAKFGASVRQIQGLRMGSAREIFRRRGQFNAMNPLSNGTSETPPPSVDDVVRYLRQQDDVVIRQPNGGFLVNGRFQLQVEELVSRANQMRRRQHKPEFLLTKLPLAAAAPANGHPLPG